MVLGIVFWNISYYNKEVCMFLIRNQDHWCTLHERNGFKIEETETCYDAG
jgi:hypothetical protein